MNLDLIGLERQLVSLNLKPYQSRPISKQLFKESSIDWNNLNETLAGNPFPPPGVASGMMMGGLPWSTSTPNGAPVTNANIHFHFQCWPQCLGLRRPYLCIGKSLSSLPVQHPVDFRSGV